MNPPPSGKGVIRLTGHSDSVRGDLAEDGGGEAGGGEGEGERPRLRAEAGHWHRRILDVAESEEQYVTWLPVSQVGLRSVNTGPVSMSHTWDSSALPSPIKDGCESTFPLHVPAASSRACMAGMFCDTRSTVPTGTSNCRRCPGFINDQDICPPDNQDCFYRCRVDKVDQGNKEWSVAPVSARLLVMKVIVSGFSSTDKVGISTFSHKASSLAHSNPEALVILSKDSCKNSAGDLPGTTHPVSLQYGAGCTWVEAKLTIRAPWTLSSDDYMGVVVRASCWTAGCRVNMTVSAYESTAVCPVNYLGTSPYGIIDALDPFENFWPGTDANSTSNLIRYPHGDFENSTVRYKCTNCSGDYPQTAHVASSSLSHDTCMTQCRKGTESAAISFRGLRAAQSICPPCRVGTFAAADAQAECTKCEEGYTTPDLGASFAWYCYRAELTVERIWRMGQNIVVQFEWRVIPPGLARTDDMVAIHSGANGLRQLAWAYTSAPSGGPSQEEHKTEGSKAVSHGSHTLYFASAGVATYHLRFSSMMWKDQEIESKVLFAILPFRLEGWLTAGICARGQDNALCIPEDTGQQILGDGLLCANGAIARERGFLRCPPCPRGEAGTLFCAPCPIGTYADKVGLDSCKQCSTGSVAMENGTSCDGDRCCISCAKDTQNLPQCPQQVQLTAQGMTPEASTTPAPSKTTTRRATTPALTTTAANSKGLATPPPSTRAVGCGDGQRIPAMDDKCWTSAFSGLKVTIANSTMTSCRSEADSLFFADESAGGDGRYHMPEECDDRNLNDGDGCSSKCTIETTFECAPERTVFDDSMVSDRCFERKEPSLGFFRSLAPLDERSRSQGRGGGGAETLDWYTQMTGVDGLLHIDKYKIPDSHYPRESGWFQAHFAATDNTFDTVRLPGLFKVAEDVEMSSINTYQTLHLNPFSEACSGDDKDERSLNQWVGEILAHGRDRARTQTCKWILRPFGAGSITIDLTFNLRKHKDRLEIRDSGLYEINGERYSGECSPCGFPMESDQYIPESTVPYKMASKFQGKVAPNFNAQGVVDSYSARMIVGPSVAVTFYSDGSDIDDGVPFAGLSDTLGPNAFRLSYRASAEMYNPSTTTPARRSSPTTATTNAYSQDGRSVRNRDTLSEQDTPSDSAAVASARGRSTSSSEPREDRGEVHRAENHIGDRISTVNILTAPSSRVMIGDATPPTSPLNSAKRQDSQDLFPTSLTLEFSDDWAWKTQIPKAFGTSAVRFVRQQDQECAEGKKDQLQGEWEGETMAQGLASGVAEFVGSGQCQPAYSLIAAESNNIATSHDACLELCGSIAGSKCTFYSYAEGSGTCLLFSSCPGPLAGSSEYLTWEVPYDRFVKLTCKVWMLVRETQISAHIYACGGKADGIRRSFQEGFNDGTAYFTCKADRACTDPGTFPCLFKETTTSFTYYRYYQFSITWTRRSPDRAAGLSRGLYTFSVVDNGFLFSEKNLELPTWTLQVYLPEQESGAYPNILDRFVPLVLQPSKAQVLNLKQSEVKHSLSMQALSSIYPRMVSNYKLCNSSVATLLVPGQSLACAALVKLLFPSSAVTNPSGLTSAKLAAAGAPGSECYEDMLYKLRKTADVCSTIWQECDERCITPVPECGGPGHDRPTSEGPGRFVARVTSDNILVRELVKKIVHLADAIFYLTTAAYGSRRGERCGVPFRDLVAKIPQLGACQVQEFLDSSVAGCYNNTPQQIMNAPFLVRKSENCSAACHKGLDSLLDIYGCCTATDRNAQAEWWQRVGHPRFKTFIVAWTLDVQELFISPSTSVEEDTCADSARAYIDCSLPKCKHDSDGQDPQWKGWMDYPPPCCRMECPGRATKSFPYSCSCICTLGFVSEWCNTTQTHVLAEIQITGISARSFEKKNKQDTLIDNVFPLLQVQREKIEIDFFQDAADGLPPLPAGARLDPAGGWARRAVVGTDGNETGEGRRQIEARAAVIVRFRVLVQTERAGLRIAQLLSNPSKLQLALIEAGFVKGDRRKQPSVVNTFLPMTLDSKGMHLCDNVLYACPVLNTALNQTTADRVADVSIDELILALIIICPIILVAVLYLCYIHFEKIRVLWPLLHMCCVSCGEVGRKYSKRARDSLRQTTQKREKKRRGEASPYITGSDFERMTATRRLRPEMHSEGLTAWCAERESDVYAPTGAVLFTQGSTKLKRTNVPSIHSARLGRGLRLGSPGLHSDLVFTPSSVKESSRQLDHMEGSRSLKYLEERRNVDQVLELLRTKRYWQPEYVVTCLQEEYDLGLTHNVAQLAQVAALESTANVSAMPVSMYGIKRYSPASACTLTLAPRPVRLECNQTQSTAESEFQARQKNRQPIVTLGQGQVPPIPRMLANVGIALTDAGGPASTGDSRYEDTAVTINRRPSESVERVAPASARAVAALNLEPSHPVPMTPAEVWQRWEACKKMADSNTKRFTTHLRHPIHIPHEGGREKGEEGGGSEVDNVLYNSRNSANSSRVMAAVYMEQVPVARATVEGDSLYTSLDSVSSTIGTPLTAEERGKRLKGLVRKLKERGGQREPSVIERTRRGHLHNQSSESRLGLTSDNDLN